MLPLSVFIKNNPKHDMTISETASAVYNHVVDGLRGYHSTPTISLEQLDDEVVEERLAVIKEWYFKGLFNRKDQMLAINCIEVDCSDRAKCCKRDFGKRGLHFEIPPLVNDLGNDALEFVGSVDREVQFVIYTDTTYQYHKYRKRGSDRPFVYIETTPNENGMYDGWIFNVPYIKYIAVIGIFKDPRMLEGFNCCKESTYLNIDALASTIKERLVRKYLMYYRQMALPVINNDQQPR